MIQSDCVKGQALSLADLIEYREDKPSFKTVWNNGNGAQMLVALPAGGGLAEHLAPEDVMILLLEGDARFTVGATTTRLGRGDFLLMDKDQPHSVEARADTKFLLTKIKP